jgi:ferredoxin-NADP reductase
MNVIFDHSEDEAENIRSFYFKPEAPLVYTAGQFSELNLIHPHPDSRGIKRWFTLSSSPKDNLLSITTKYAGDKKSSSFKKSLFKLEPGTPATMAEPMGDFVLPKLIQTPLLFIALGIGITPYLIYGVKSEEEVLFQTSMAKANQHATIVVESPSAAWGGERGKLDAQMILGIEKPASDSLIYVSGPELAVEDIQNELIHAGIKKTQLVLDFFPNYQAI